MSIETGLVERFMADAVVSAIVGTRMYPVQVPQDADRPALAYQRISGPRDYVQTGPSGLAQARIQFTCEGTTYAEAKSLAAAVRANLDRPGSIGDTTGNCFVENEIDGWSQGFAAPVVRLDALIFYQE